MGAEFSVRQLTNSQTTDFDQPSLLSTDVEDTKECMKSRYVLGLLGFFGFANVYAMRVNLSVAIVAMVNYTAIATPIHNHSDLTDFCPVPANYSAGEDFENEGEFVWNEEVQGLVLGSFFYGYVVTQIPGGRLAELFGGKWVFGLGVFITAVLTLLSPIAVRCDYRLFIVLRVLEGMGEGVTYPAMHVMLAHWIPPLERSKFSAYVYAGANFGTVVSLPVSGWLCSIDLVDGWPLCFYVFGALGVIWFVFWMFFVYDIPMKHPRIHPSERFYIISNLGREYRHHSVKLPPIPWCKMLTCMPLWAILVTQSGIAWSFYTRLTELPTYMDHILHFNIQHNALLSALPYLTSWFLGVALSILADYLLAKGYLSLLTSYKIFNSLCTFGPALGLIGIAFVGCDRVAIQLLLIIPGAFQGAVFAGNQMNHIALSPKYAGTMFGITNTAANMCGFLAPYVVGVLIKGHETVSRWNVVFFLSAGINIGGNIFYLIFASAEEQKWSRNIHSIEDLD